MPNTVPIMYAIVGARTHRDLRYRSGFVSRGPTVWTASHLQESRLFISLTFLFTFMGVGAPFPT